MKASIIRDLDCTDVYCLENTASNYRHKVNMCRKYVRLLLKGSGIRLSKYDRIYTELTPSKKAKTASSFHVMAERGCGNDYYLVASLVPTRDYIPYTRVPRCMLRALLRGSGIKTPNNRTECVKFYITASKVKEGKC